MKLGTHMPDGERRKPIDIEVCRTKWRKIDLDRISAKIDIQGNHDVTSSSIWPQK